MAVPHPPVSPPGGGEDAPFFHLRDGDVWACWHSGKPAVRLGRLPEVVAALDQLGWEATAAEPEPAPAAPAASPAPSHSVEEERGEQRHDISIIGRIRTATGARDVTVLDLSERGCRFYDRFGQLPIGTAITIKLGPIGPIAAAVKWRRGEYVGVQFENALYPSVLDHIRQHFDLNS